MKTANASAVFSALTSREREALALLSEGYLVKNFGHLMSCAKRTGEKHVQNLCDKLGAKTLAHAVQLGWQYGLLPVTAEHDTRPAPNGAFCCRRCGVHWGRGTLLSQEPLVCMPLTVERLRNPVEPKPEGGEE